MRLYIRPPEANGTLSGLSPLPPQLSVQPGDGRMTIAEFKIELARLLKKGSIAGLSSNAMADELTDVAEHLTSNGEHDELV